MEQEKRVISIICPIYRGKQYIDSLIKMASRNAENLKNFWLELVLVNDSPEEKIVVNRKNVRNFSIRVIESKRNRGIHGARILGLKRSKGEFVLFLDQDDKIVDNCIERLICNIGKSDAILSNGYSHTRKSRRIIYNSLLNPIEQAWSLQKNFFQDNQIVSPGQVLIRRKSIPLEWKRRIIKMNGADDWYLWILMLKKKCDLKILNENLYFHTFNCLNTSDNEELMEQSRQEVIDTLKKEHVINLFEYRIWKQQLKYLYDVKNARVDIFKYPIMYILNLIYDNYNYKKERILK